MNAQTIAFLVFMTLFSAVVAITPDGIYGAAADIGFLLLLVFLFYSVFVR